ncbi:MAG TPA: arsenosugar biosynthesis radical SAM (seleno)protein ArsS [Gemmatimonadales bacterium]|nr:arsenosugar biosynthesis radical SAM (seleno)protein ArsS [Gemmatimonadales bacterium]
MGRVLPTLAKARAPLAAAAVQRDRLDRVPVARRFDDALADSGLFPLTATRVDILQINLGKRCNQTCAHCHVDAGPDRTEVMPRAVMEACLAFFEREEVPTLDVTGGAPELHPDFREIIVRASATGRRVMHRCNLTATLLPNYADIPALLAEHRVEVVASLPYFQARETDAQRGEGVFEESIAALRRFNELGYGQGTGLVLDLVTNPVGTYLPGNQRSLEAHWKRQMMTRYGIAFDHLYTITNMPISRFLEFLEKQDKTEEYMARLVAAYNPAAAAGVMCRNTLSVGWDGTLYDCDFNQMLELPLAAPAPRTIFDAVRDALDARSIVTGPHCFGCTAGAGSSCGGAVA